MAQSTDPYDLILFGGRRDPNIVRLCETAARLNVSCLLIMHDEQHEPAVTWDFSAQEFRIDGRCVSARSAFLRYDVFSSSNQSPAELDRAYGWFTTVFGACAATPDMRVANARMDMRASHKAFMLAFAQSHGIAIPDTRITNEENQLDAFCEDRERIAKPVAGGAYCIQASEARGMTDWHEGKAPIPAIVQDRLVYPEYRVFRFGEGFMTFEITSDHLDYRPHRDTQIKPVGNDVLGDGVIERLKTMTDRLSIDFFACDFKTHADTGVPLFLELNSGPMFAAYDAAADLQLSEGMVHWLTAPGAQA